MQIIDTHCHAGLNWFEPIETLVHEMDSNGVQFAVLVQHGGAFDNGYLLSCAARFDGRFKVVVLLDPKDPDQPGTLEGLAEQGISGVRLRPESRTRGSDPFAVWKKAGDLGLVVSCQGATERFASDDFKKLLDCCGDTSIVIEHLGLSGYDEAQDERYTEMLGTSEWPNVTIKVPGLGEFAERPVRHRRELHFDEIPPLIDRVREYFGANRMMWGSDFPPVAGREGYRNALEGIRDYPVFAKGDEATWVMGRTAAHVWGFPTID